MNKDQKKEAVQSEKFLNKEIKECSKKNVAIFDRGVEDLLYAEIQNARCKSAFEADKLLVLKTPPDQLESIKGLRVAMQIAIMQIDCNYPESEINMQLFYGTLDI